MSRAPVLVACALRGPLEAGSHSGELRPEPTSQAETWRLESADKRLPNGTEHLRLWEPVRLDEQS